MSEPIEIVPYDPAWPEAFRLEADRIQAVLGASVLRVAHVGSTSVPDLAAKPVIDIQVSVAALEPMEGWCERLAPLGYRHQVHPDDAAYPFFHRPEGWPHSHHVHLCVTGSREEQRHLALPSFLREHAEAALAYAEEKRRLAAAHHAGSFASRNAYSNAKSHFLEPLIGRAIAEGHPRGV